jgi:predicted nucleotidyltransferase
MKPSEAFAQHRETIRRLVLESGMTNPRLFDLARLQIALEDAVGIPVDVRLPDELHPKFREHVVSEAVAL